MTFITCATPVKTRVVVKYRTPPETLRTIDNLKRELEGCKSKAGSQRVKTSPRIIYIGPWGDTAE
ncbi:MAG: hypothetical protein ACXAC5_03825 [Promethearchaeota archaeon]